MRTDVFELSEENWPRSIVATPFYERLQQERTRRSSIMASGLLVRTPTARSTLNPISTCISRIESWCLNLSSRGARRLNISYWIFTVLCCIAFFTSHWSIFLALLIPALAMSHMRVARKTWKKHLAYHYGHSTSGT